MPEIRPATADDLGELSYLALMWDAELPEELKQIKGRADWAERMIFIALNDPRFHLFVLAEDEIVGTYCIAKTTGIFSPEPYGQLLFFYVKPKYRGGKFYGLRILNHAVETAKGLDISYLEALPWSFDTNTGKVLARLGFSDAVHCYARKLP